MHAILSELILEIAQTFSLASLPLHFSPLRVIFGTIIIPNHCSGYVLARKIGHRSRGMEAITQQILWICYGRYTGLLRHAGTPGPDLFPKHAYGGISYHDG